MNYECRLVMSEKKEFPKCVERLCADFVLFIAVSESAKQEFQVLAEDESSFGSQITHKNSFFSFLSN